MTEHGNLMDRIFKPVVVLLLIGLLLVAYRSSENGRYIQMNDTIGLLDTRTGIMYAPKAATEGPSQWKPVTSRVN